jgi:NAD(P)-dependent dehydrogenase (short-subunit alcohol dehydrogenase family)
MSDSAVRRFQGKTVIVTGAGTGVGRATALAFAREGARVVAASRRANLGESTVAAIEALRGEALYVQTDVSQSRSVRILVDTAQERYGEIDILVNNAGIMGAYAQTADCTEEQWDELLDTNLKGAWLCMKQVIPSMVQRGRGVIINVSSTAAVKNYPGLSAYSASKAGLEALTRVAALEYAKAGLRIKSLCVGGVRTAMNEAIRATAEDEERFAAFHPVGRGAEPEEVAEAILWLSSDQASFVIGPALSITGGLDLR